MSRTYRRCQGNKKDRKNLKTGMPEDYFWFPAMDNDLSHRSMLYHVMRDKPWHARYIAGTALKIYETRKKRTANRLLTRKIINDPEISDSSCFLPAKHIVRRWHFWYY